MKNLLSLVIMISLSSVLSAQIDMDQFYQVDAGHSYLEFSVKYMGYAKVKGQFEKFSGMIRYNENNLQDLSASFSVEMSSIDTDGEWRDKDLKSVNWFDVETYPQMTFVSKSVTKTSSGFDLTGNLTIKDVTQSVTFQMDSPSGVLKDTRGDLQIIFTGVAEIDRTEFNVEGKRWSGLKEGIASVSDMVQIEISILGKRYQERNLSGFVRSTERPQGQINAAYNEGGIKNALEKFDQLSQNPEAPINSNALNLVAHYLMVKNQVEDALTLFEKNSKTFPEEANVHISLGEAYARLGKLAKAKASFQKGLEIDPGNTSAIEILRHLNNI